MSHDTKILDELEAAGVVAPSAPKLAQEREILTRFGRDVRLSGVVGEEKIAKLLFLSLITRLLDRPTSIAVKGPSSGGKSYTIEQTLSFFPASAYFERTAMSPRNLAYTKESFEHRFIVLFEAAAMGDDDDIGQYLIRSLLSEGRLLYEFVDTKKSATVLIDKAGPTGLIVSTTHPTLHAENETRMLSVTVTDTREQTKAVMRRIAEDANGMSVDVVERRPWLELQAWLEHAEHRVLVPFAPDLAELVEPEAVRLRRDFKAVLGLIKAHAICHQLNRDRDEHGRIVATLDDYTAVYEVVVDAVSEGIGKTVSATVRETVAAVATLVLAHPDGVALGALAKELKVDKATASRRARAARYGGYLENLEDRRGHPARYKVGESLPDPAKALPEPSKLAEHARPLKHLQHLQHPPERNGPATVGATPSDVKSAGQGANSGTVAGVAGVSGGKGEPLHSPLQDRCNEADSLGGIGDESPTPVTSVTAPEAGTEDPWVFPGGLRPCFVCDTAARGYHRKYEEHGWLHPKCLERILTGEVVVT